MPTSQDALDKYFAKVKALFLEWNEKAGERLDTFSEAMIEVAVRQATLERLVVARGWVTEEELERLVREESSLTNRAIFKTQH